MPVHPGTQSGILAQIKDLTVAENGVKYMVKVIHKEQHVPQGGAHIQHSQDIRRYFQRH